jgi:hypothetical protein
MGWSQGATPVDSEEGVGLSYRPLDKSLTLTGGDLTTTIEEDAH